jgi:hypothetical protein
MLRYPASSAAHTAVTATSPLSWQGTAKSLRQSLQRVQLLHYDEAREGMVHGSWALMNYDESKPWRLKGITRQRQDRSGHYEWRC